MTYRWMPDQHGAWAMLAVPFLTGTFLSPHPGWAHAALFAAWLLGYAAAFHGQQWLRLHARGLRSARRHGVPAVVCGTAAAQFALPLAFFHPWLLLPGAAALPFVAVNTRYAWRGRERALLNGLAAVVPACGMLLVAAGLGGLDPAAAWRPAAACLLYFGGTVPYVKTMIRERRSAAYRRGSAAYHAVALALATALSWWLAPVFAACLGRAVLLPGRGLRPAKVGAVELALSATLLTTLLLAF
ncbi:YwiC-like family protein [Streptomyces sp. NPDC089915]|uniref:YwiC-like family protein n=1 Tax=Streptomyces sp. NPDC089915 TaxID=3155186 RepID=UPI003445A33B